MKRILVICLAALLPSACGGDDGEAQTAPGSTSPTSPAVTVTTTLQPSTPAETETASTGPAEPNVGDRALRIGQTRQGSAITTRLVAIKYPYPPGQYREPQAGKQFFGLRLKQCLREEAPSAGMPYYSTTQDEWFVTTPSGSQYSGGSGWIDWPSPKFPEYAGMNLGECLLGWMTVEVPEGTKVERVVFRPFGSPAVAEWLP